MHGMRRTSVWVLSVAILFVCSCATIDTRLSEDLRADGFTISVYENEEGASGSTVTVADAESAERLAQWLRNRPRASKDLAAEILLDVAADVMHFRAFITIETTRLRVSLPMYSELPVILETRSTPAEDWEKVFWKTRGEDMELQRWAITRLNAESDASVHAFR